MFALLCRSSLQTQIFLFLIAKRPFVWQKFVYYDKYMIEHAHRHDADADAFLLRCHLEERAPWQIARSASNGNENSQSSQPNPNTCPFQIAKVRDLDFLQNDEIIIYICKYPL